MNRPYIKPEVIQKVKLRKIEEEKASLKRQREFIFEQQRQAFLQQQAVSCTPIISEELEEEQGMSM